MELHGHHLIGGETSRAGHGGFAATDPETGETLATTFCDATSAEIDRALALAAAAHPAFEVAGRELRAGLLEAIAGGIEALGDGLLHRAAAETALPLPRLEGERGRTCGQLRMFAQVVRQGSYLDLRIDLADGDRRPIPKPDVRSMQRALGPTVVFGASNFPLAFSVAGGDTASALAAGCPVVVKAHPHHPGTAELVGRVIASAVRAAQLPEGTFSLLQGRHHAVGTAMVEHAAAKAVAFTGSLQGGRALFDLAAARPEPIPVFAEMGSTNPVFLLPRRLAQAAGELAHGIAASVTLGVGQFCTNPGLVVAPRIPALDELLQTLTTSLKSAGEAAMLHAGIKDGYDTRLNEICAVNGVEVAYRGESTGACGAEPCLLAVAAERFIDHATLRGEVFGPSTMVVVCDDTAQQLAVARALGGQLTATIHAAEGDFAVARELLAIVEQKAGRVLFGGYPTGVEVCSAMVHGGPYPATTDSRTTSVGAAAIERFTRPVAYQNLPRELLPEELRDQQPSGKVDSH